MAQRYNNTNFNPWKIVVGNDITFQMRCSLIFTFAHHATWCIMAVYWIIYGINKHGFKTECIATVKCNCVTVTTLGQSPEIFVPNLIAFCVYLNLLTRALCLSCTAINYWTCDQWRYYIKTTQFKVILMLWTEWLWLQIFHAKELLNIILGDSLASEFHVPTFRNIVSHIHRYCKQ